MKILICNWIRLLMAWSVSVILVLQVQAQHSSAVGELRQAFEAPSEEARPWVFWYWMQGSVSREGILSDLKAMKQGGIGGAYLMFIDGKENATYPHPVEQLSSEWWSMVHYAAEVADSLHLQLAMHDCDGFAVAGGPWITPEKSMQKLVWTVLKTEGTGGLLDTILPRPEAFQGFYRDIRVVAFPYAASLMKSSYEVPCKVSSSIEGTDVSFLNSPGSKNKFSSKTSCWIQYSFSRPFTCRAVEIITGQGFSYQAQRLLIMISDDGIHFRPWERLSAARQGWQDGDASNMHSLRTVTARYFRFVYDKQGSEPGAEDLDAAKWKPVLKLSGIVLHSTPYLNAIDGKNGTVWRIGTPGDQVPDSLCIPRDNILDLTSNMDLRTGRLRWQVPKGSWVIMRLGHTSMGHTNATGGGGKGLECDKLDSATVRYQFENWYGEIIRHLGPGLSDRVLKIFHVDSWECGSQNWTNHLAATFQASHGYNLLDYAPLLAGFPVNSDSVSEKILRDFRQTIDAMLTDQFFGTMHRLAAHYGKLFSSESVAPTMLSDGIHHFDEVDIPMGEFWLNSPTHDKPSDMLDAISGADIYGKSLVQAEAFTELRIGWDELPSDLKNMLDRNYCRGINRMVFHVFMHNPWSDRRPGMTLNGVGLYFQRDQTWWPQVGAFTQYAARCQALLQKGLPVKDIAVFTGEELPSRSILPERLTKVLPGLMGVPVVNRENRRSLNIGEPFQEEPKGVWSSANMDNAQDDPDPLHGYSYDSFNRDALLRLSSVKDQELSLPAGMRYRVLVLPGKTRMDPSGILSQSVEKRLFLFEHQGLPVIYADTIASNVLMDANKHLSGAWTEPTLDRLGIEPDLLFYDQLKEHSLSCISWIHRKYKDCDIYFISNQSSSDSLDNILVSSRLQNRKVEIWDPLDGSTAKPASIEKDSSRTCLSLSIPAGRSAFLIFYPFEKEASSHSAILSYQSVRKLKSNWHVSFPDGTHSLRIDEPESWTKLKDSAYWYTVSPVLYRIGFTWSSSLSETYFLNLGQMRGVCDVRLNGVDLGTIWTNPFRIALHRALKRGNNILELKVAGSWHNAIVHEAQMGGSSTNAPIERVKSDPLTPSGILGPVTIERGL